jgi:hypothetical protein
MVWRLSGGSRIVHPCPPYMYLLAVEVPTCTPPISNVLYWPGFLHVGQSGGAAAGQVRRACWELA